MAVCMANQLLVSGRENQRCGEFSAGTDEPHPPIAREPLRVVVQVQPVASRGRRLMGTDVTPTLPWGVQRRNGGAARASDSVSTDAH